MDRSNRTAILEPIMLILKQRTGIASIAAVVVAVLMLANNYRIEEVAMVVAPIFAYIGRQTYIDSKENSQNLTKEIVDVLEVLGVLKTDVTVEEKMLEVTDTGNPANG